MVDGFKTTVHITTKSLEFESRSFRGVLDTTLCDKVCSGSPVSSTSKTDRHDITEILLKVVLNTIIHNHMIMVKYT